MCVCKSIEFRSFSLDERDIILKMVITISSLYLNPCVARAVCIQFQACFAENAISLKFIQ